MKLINEIVTAHGLQEISFGLIEDQVHYTNALLLTYFTNHELLYYSTYIIKIDKKYLSTHTVLTEERTYQARK